MPKAVRKAWNIVTTVLVALTVVCVVLLVGVRLVGIKPYAVLSGSMEPEYPVGSLLYVKSVDTSKLCVGDDITFMLNEDTLATHRIVGIIPDEDNPEVIRFKTRGIANEYEDGGTVHCNNVVGKPIFDIPYLGYFSSYIRTPPGLYVAVGCAAVILLAAFVPDILKEKPQKESSEVASED